MDELEVVVLTEDLPAVGLVEGDLGTIVQRYRSANGAVEAYELEVVGSDGQTLVLTTVSAQGVRKRRPTEVLHVRAFA